MARELTELERAEVRELWAQKLPVRVIARTVGRPHTTVRLYVDRLRRPAPARTRWVMRLSLVELEVISRGLAAGESLRAIARRLGRAPSTVSREVRANCGRSGYRAVAADEAAWRRAVRPKQPKLVGSELLRWLVEAALERPRGHSTFNGQGQLAVQTGARFELRGMQPGTDGYGEPERV